MSVSSWAAGVREARSGDSGGGCDLASAPGLHTWLRRHVLQAACDCGRGEGRAPQGSHAAVLVGTALGTAGAMLPRAITCASLSFSCFSYSSSCFDLVSRSPCFVPFVRSYFSSSFYSFSSSLSLLLRIIVILVPLLLLFSSVLFPLKSIFSLEKILL